MKVLKWITIGYSMLHLTCGFASEFDPNALIFDSATLLDTKSLPGLTSEMTTHRIKHGHLFGGLFMYALDAQQPIFIAGSETVPTDTQTPALNPQPNNLYGHVFGRLFDHLFLDLAGGYKSNSHMLNEQYNSTWVTSATAMFSHTWKEFVFNANFGLTHINAEYSPYMPFVAQALSSSLTKTFFDQNTTNIGGGITFNYKQYALSLEQQYLQQGNKYNNQAVLSVKLNLD